MKIATEPLKFVLVGGAAALVHVFCVWMLVLLKVQPLIGNIVGFVVAFQVSYFGHCHVTFENSPSRSSYKRMLAVAGIGFLINEVAYWALLRFASFDYRISLGLVLIGVAAITYLVSRSWVFTEHGRAGPSESEGNRNKVTVDVNEAKRAWFSIGKSIGIE